MRNFKQLESKVNANPNDRAILGIKGNNFITRRAKD
jgi:hypothetical protein